MMSVDTAPKEMLSTPMRAQRCLFGSSKSSSKKSIHSSGRKRRKDDSDDSDIGPMSPLTFSDHSPSSCNSSPRYLYSPADKSQTISSPLSSHASWDRLTSNRSSVHTKDSPLTSFKNLTMPIKQSPRRKLVLASPKLSPRMEGKILRSPRTPENSEMTMISDEIIPETPPRNFGREIQNGIIETPSKYSSPEYKLITPMSSECKVMSMPKLPKRKSILVDTTEENSSPDRSRSTLKRHAHEPLGNHSCKLVRTDENASIPKARAALFQEKSSESKLKGFTLSTKSFYSSSEKKENVQKFHIKPDVEQKRQRWSLPTHGTQIKRTARRHTFGKINAGVSHGIKRRKPKSTSELTKKSPAISTKSENQKQTTPISVTEPDSPVHSMKRPASPEFDPNKRFFKTKPSMHYNATVTVVSHKIKLKVKDGKLALNAKNGTVRQPVKRQKLADISFDATDLTVDEPEMEASVQKCKLDNILKVLEEDWADDEDEVLETLTNQPRFPESPIRRVVVSNDIVMSPGSELSNLTSTMNIGDVATSSESAIDNNDNNDTTLQKYFPLFAKGFAAKIQPENKKAGSNGRKGLNWQLTAKESDGDKQYQLDVGQKRFGAITCMDCGVIYQVGEPEDEMAHLNYHNSRNTLKFPGWKTERVIFEDPMTQSRIIFIEPDDNKQCWNKVTNILTVVDRDLGLVDAQLSEYQNKRVYLYIRDKVVLGVLVAEPIKTAHRMIPELLELDCCTAESTPAKCGVSVIWTVMTHRKQGIATKLVDTLRAHFYYGYIMSRDDIAFSIPTPSGKTFAVKYTKTQNFKVYS